MEMALKRKFNDERQTILDECYDWDRNRVLQGNSPLASNNVEINSCFRFVFETIKI